MVDVYDDWRDERPEERPERRGPRRSEPRLEQRLDQWVSAGRQLVDGVAGARPGSRPGARGSGLKLDHLGRWVEDKLDWLLEDEEGWRESWEGQPAGPQPQRRSRREPLQAISRRRPKPAAPAVEPAADAEAWPDDDSFTVPRWQRGDGGSQSEPPSASPRLQSGRTLPRSSRRRFD